MSVKPARHLITLGIAEYDMEAACAPDSRLDRQEVEQAVQRVTRVFEGLGYDHVLALSDQPQRGTVLDRLDAWMRTPRSDPALLVMYVMAHGLVGANNKHVLLMRDHGNKRTSETVIRAGELVDALRGDSILDAAGRSPMFHYRGVLLILDSCYSGAALPSLLEAFGNDSQGEEEYLDLIATAWDLMPAAPPCFSTALQETIGAIRGRFDEWRSRGPALPFEQILSGVSERMGSQRLKRGGVGAPPLVWFPNPHHDPDLPEAEASAGDEHVPRQLVELRDHWLPRARGVSSGFGFGWYFTGREKLLNDLEAFLYSQQTDGRLRVVTGSPGAGKSAVLAQLVVRRHQNLNSHANREDGNSGSLAALVGVWANEKTVEQVTDELAYGCGVLLVSENTRDRVNELIASVQTRERRISIVVDALDEAAAPDALSSMLSRLSSAQTVCVVVAARHELLPKLGNIHCFDLDNDESAVALQEYVTRRLLCADEPWRETPYRDRPDLARRVAAAVAARAKPLFLVAQVVSDLLLASPLVDPNDPDWYASLPDTSSQAFELYLKQFGKGREGVERVLLPLAYAKGTGLPRRLWSRLVTALTGFDCPTAAIDRAYQDAGAYIVTSTDAASENVSRIYHQAFADYLTRGLSSQESNKRIVDALVAELPVRKGLVDFRSAVPYVRDHLATHAADGKLLDELVENPTFLVAAEPSRLVAALPAVETARAEASVYRHARGWMAGRPSGEAAACLLLSARSLGAMELVRKIDELQLASPWSVRWVGWNQETAHRVLVHGHSRLTARHDDGAMTLSCVDSNDVLVMAGYDDWLGLLGGGAIPTPLHVLSVNDGTRILPSLTGHMHFVKCVASLVIDGDPSIVSGSSDGTWRLWNLRDRGVRGGASAATFDEIVVRIAAIEIEGSPCAVTGSAGGTLQVWNLRNFTERMGPLRGHEGKINGIATFTLGTEAHAVSASADGTLRVWNLCDGSGRTLIQGRRLFPIHTTLRDALNFSTAGNVPEKVGFLCVAYREVDGEPCIIAGTTDGTLRLWNAHVNGLRLAGHAHAVTCVATFVLDGEAMSISGSHDGKLLLWNLRDGSPRSQPLVSDDIGIRCVVVAERDGEPQAISESRDGTIRVWNLRDACVRTSSIGAGGHRGAIVSLAICNSRNEPCVVTGSNDCTARAWNLLDGSARPELLCVSPEWSEVDTDRSPQTPFERLVGLDIDGEPCVVSISERSTLRLWGLDDSTERLEARALAAVKATLTVLEIEGQPCAIAGTASGELYCWNLRNGSLKQYRSRAYEEQPIWRLVGLALDGHACVVSSSKGTQLITLSNDAAIRRTLCGDIDFACIALVALDDQPCAILGSSDGTIRVCSLLDGSGSDTPLGRMQTPIGWIASFELEGERCVLAGSGVTAQLWSLRDRTSRQVIKFPVPIVDVVVFQHNGVDHVIAATPNGLISLVLSSAMLNQLPEVVVSEADGREKPTSLVAELQQLSAHGTRLAIVRALVDSPRRLTVRSLPERPSVELRRYHSMRCALGRDQPGNIRIYYGSKELAELRALVAASDIEEDRTELANALLSAHTLLSEPGDGIQCDDLIDELRTLAIREEATDEQHAALAEALSNAHADTLNTSNAARAAALLNELRSLAGRADRTVEWHPALAVTLLNAYLFEYEDVAVARSLFEELKMLAQRDAATDEERVAYALALLDMQGWAISSGNTVFARELVDELRALADRAPRVGSQRVFFADALAHMQRSMKKDSQATEGLPGKAVRDIASS